MTKEEYNTQCIKTYEAAISEGASIAIDQAFSWVYIVNPNGEEWFFQGHEANELLNTVPEYINAEHFLIHTSQGW